jgi:hypothetical protein
MADKSPVSPFSYVGQGPKGHEGKSFFTEGNEANEGPMLQDSCAANRSRPSLPSFASVKSILVPFVSLW